MQIRKIIIHNDTLPTCGYVSIHLAWPRQSQCALCPLEIGHTLSGWWTLRTCHIHYAVQSILHGVVNARHRSSSVLLISALRSYSPPSSHVEINILFLLFHLFVSHFTMKRNLPWRRQRCVRSYRSHHCRPNLCWPLSLRNYDLHFKSHWNDTVFSVFFFLLVLFRFFK